MVIIQSYMFVIYINMEKAIDNTEKNQNSWINYSDQLLKRNNEYFRNKWIARMINK